MSKFKVLLVYPNLQMVNLLPTNIAVLSAYLKRAGIEVRLFDTTLYRTTEKSVDEIRVEHLQLRPFNLKEKGVDYKDTDVFEDFRHLVEQYQPDLIGVTATDDTFDLGMDLILQIKRKEIHVTVGGVFSTFSPEEAIDNKNVDSICIGEGEKAFVELCLKIRAKKDITGIKNMWVKKSGRIYKNTLRELVDLDEIPCEDFSIFEEKRFFRPMQGKIYRMLPITIDRGCPFICSFCAAPATRKIYKASGRGNYFRIKKTKRIIDELRFYIKEYNPDYIYFNSETFFARDNDDEIKQFAKEYARKAGLPFWCQTRIDTITQKKIEMLESMNCDRISIGIEHGNEKFRRKVIKKNFTNEQVINAFKLLEKRKISVTVNNIIGFPDETRELAFDTIRLNREIKADSINVYFFAPYRGTPLRDYCLEKGYIKPNTKTDSLMRSSVLNMPQFSADEIKGLVRTFPLYVKMDEGYFDKIRIAEQLNPKGNSMFAQLSEIYLKKYLN